MAFCKKLNSVSLHPVDQKRAIWPYKHRALLFFTVVFTPDTLWALIYSCCCLLSQPQSQPLCFTHFLRAAGAVIFLRTLSSYAYLLTYTDSLTKRQGKYTIHYNFILLKLTTKCLVLTCSSQKSYWPKPMFQPHFMAQLYKGLFTWLFHFFQTTLW